MADKSVGELIAAQSVTPTDLFVLEQNGTAKKLTGQILENWLLSFAGGHGGIQSIVKTNTSGLADTYRITFSDASTVDFVVTNGKGINSVTKTETSGLIDTYTIQYNDGTSGTFTVTNGSKGDKGDTQYVWIKYASQKPTESSHSFGDVPDNWIGIYSGDADTAPADWTAYSWFEIKGEKGDTGESASLVNSAVEYQVGDSGTIIPSSAWLASVPAVSQGKYLWTRTTNTFNSGSPVVSYSVSRMGLDGSGSVSSVSGISPNPDGNVPLTAGNIGALPVSGGTMTGPIHMNGQILNGLNSPVTDNEAATKGYVDELSKMTLLWQNASPESGFSLPTLSLNTSGYSAFVVVYKICAAYNVYATAICINGKSGWLATATGSGGVTGTYVFFTWRKISFETSGSVAFSSGMRNDKNSFTPIQDDTWAVPYEIYGIKGGLN